MLLLLILAFANPFINRNAAALASNRLVLLVVDNSFSMRAGTRLADAKDAAMSVLSGKGAARAQVAAFGSQLRLMTQPIEDQSALRAAVQAIQPGDGHGNFGELARAVRAMAESVHTPIELHLFSDMQRGDLAATFSDMALPANVTLVTHAVVTKAQPNWTVESVDAPGQVWGKDAKPVHVQAVIAGYGTPAAQRTVSLVVNGKTTATKTVAVPANGRATVDFPALEVPYGFSRCEVKIDAADGFPADDLRRFAVERSDPQKALLIHNYGDNRSPLYVGAALSAAAQSAFILESINVNEAADRKPSNYAFIVLSDLNSLPSLLENSLTQYVRSGGSLLIAAGTSAGGRSQIPIFGAHIIETRDYSRVPDRYMAVGSSDSSYPAVAKADGWPGVKFFYALDVDPGAAGCRARDRSPGRPDAAVARETHRRGPRGAAHLRARQPDQRFPLASRLRPLHRADRALSCGQRTPGRRATGGRLPRAPQCQGTRPRRRGHRPRGQAPAHPGRGRLRAVVPAHRGRLLPAPPRQWPPGRSRRQPRSQGIEPRRDPRRCLGAVAGQRRPIFAELRQRPARRRRTRRRKASGGTSCCWCSLPPLPNRSWPAATSARSARNRRVATTEIGGSQERRSQRSKHPKSPRVLLNRLNQCLAIALRS